MGVALMHSKGEHNGLLPVCFEGALVHQQIRPAVFPAVILRR